MNKEQLISEIRNGKALHYDIDNVELLQKVSKKCFPNSHGNPIGRYRYYYSYLDSGCMEGADSTDREPIPLSSFLDTPKMISVEVVKEWARKCRIVENMVNVLDELETFLNTHTNVK